MLVVGRKSVMAPAPSFPRRGEGEWRAERKTFCCDVTPDIDLSESGGCCCIDHNHVGDGGGICW
jgi:hypothetical protein